MPDDDFQVYWFGQPQKQRTIIPVVIGPPGTAGDQTQIDLLTATIAALAERVAVLEAAQPVPGQYDFSNLNNSGLI